MIHRKLVAPDPVLKGFRAAFYFGGEANYPNLFTAALIMACAILLWKAAALPTNSTRETSCFRLISAFLTILTLEHFFNLHEMLFTVTGQVLETALLKYFQLIWFIISAIIFLLISLTLLAGFILLPVKLRAGFAAAAILYSSGVILKLVILQGPAFNAAYAEAYTALLETGSLLLQMVAILIFFHALITFYLVHVKRPDIRLTFFAPQSDKPAADRYEDRLTEIG